MYIYLYIIINVWEINAPQMDETICENKHAELLLATVPIKDWNESIDWNHLLI